jgi:hypothetical protein
VTLSRPTLAAFGVWLLVVALGSTLVWAVISRAGEGVVSSESSTVPSPGDPLGTGPAPTGSPGDLPTDRPSASPSDSPSDRVSDSPSETPSRTPAGPPLTRSWQGQGGSVVASCSGPAVSLVAAQPDSGYSVEVSDRGPRRLEVEFESGDGEDERRSRVRASCSAGAPRFEVETDRD